MEGEQNTHKAINELTDTPLIACSLLSCHNQASDIKSPVSRSLKTQKELTHMHLHCLPIL